MISDFEAKKTEMEGLLLITPFYREDERGFFLKSIEKNIFSDFGLKVDICEEFESYSKQNVIRGLHFQTKNPQIKYVHAITGTVLDVVVDLRRNSKTFGKHLSFLLSEENHLGLWIPAGFAHGFQVLSSSAVVSYMCVGQYEKNSDSGIRWNDEEIGIKWEKPVGSTQYIISDRDKSLMTFKEFREINYGL